MIAACTPGRRLVAPSASVPVPESEIVTHLSALAPVEPEWDRLTVTNALPLTAPAWVHAWARHLAPSDVEPRVVLVRDGDELVGVAPYFVHRGTLGRRDYRQAGAGLFQRIAPLAVPGREEEVAELMAGALAAARPYPDLVTLEGASSASPWRTLLRERWPGPRPAHKYETSELSAPVVTLSAPSFEDWLAAKSSNFRGQMRRLRRQLEQAGGRSRLATSATLAGDLEAFMRLHSARWEGRGVSNLAALGAPLLEALVEAGSAHVDAGRFRLWILEVEGEAVGAQIFMAAGGEVTYWNGGWDERFSRIKPPMQALLSAVEDGFARGDRRLDLGGGDPDYKLRFADADDPLSWGGVRTPGRRAPLVGLSLAPAAGRVALRSELRRRLSEEQLARVRRLRGRLPGG